MSAPPSIVSGWSTLRHLTTSDTHLFKSGIDFACLTSLDLKTISIGTILRLNGPGCLEGAENLEDLALTVSVQFADRLLIEKAEIQLGDLFDALGCVQLRSLEILLINDGYHIGDDLNTQLEGGYFMDQLNSMQNTLETLAITLETPDDDSELEWLLDMVTSPKDTLRHFNVLKHLVVPQAFLFAAGSMSLASKSCQPKDLPPKLEILEVFYPGEEIENWVAGFASEEPGEHEPPALREITLTCRDEVGAPASYFMKEVDRIWWELATNYDIDSYALCQIEKQRSNLAQLWYEESLDPAAIEEDLDEEEGQWENDTGSSKAEHNNDIRNLIEVADDISESMETVD
ncbi:hypothetical protein ACET3X_008495 [Alternaria dauci]|uniref:Uncharacterized protein n=1 Tax=Alternaria dauci TaxID=48095 RepID=A0ABR3UC12_9PLEO